MPLGGWQQRRSPKHPGSMGQQAAEPRVVGRCSHRLLLSLLSATRLERGSAAAAGFLCCSMNCGVLLLCRQAMLLGVTALWGLAAEHSVLGACFWVDVLCCYSRNFCTTRKQGLLAQCSSPVRLLLHSVIPSDCYSCCSCWQQFACVTQDCRFSFSREVWHALCHAQTSRQHGLPGVLPPS